MEDDKRKFLLSKIRREQSLIAGEFQRFKRLYQSKEVPAEKNDSFLQQITHTMQVNNSLAANLHEYLDRPQVEAVFLRVNLIFTDLVDKYRKCRNELAFLQGPQNIKEIRQICDVCHEKIETNRIENIRRGLDAESECRTAVIKKLIQESQLERTTPVFSEEEDREFKRELEKVFQNKEAILQTTIHESNVFLATVEEEMAEFMVAFRRDFAEWGGGQQVEAEHENWGRMMKGVINKKLTNSFNAKIPSWIKKMRELFLERQTVKPKQYFMNRESQADFPTDNEEQAKAELEQLTHTLILKREALKTKEEELEHEKIRSRALKSELDSLHQFYMDKLYPGREQTKERKTPQAPEVTQGVDSVRLSAMSLEEGKGEGPSAQRQAVSKKKKKFVKMAYQMMQKSPKEFKSSDNLMFSQNSTSRNELTSEHSNEHQVRNDFKAIPQKNNSLLAQPDMRLKKKAFNREKREEGNEEMKNQSALYESRQKEKSQLKSEVKLVGQQISKDLPHKKVKRYNSISVTESADAPSQLNRSDAVVLPVLNESRDSKETVSAHHKHATLEESVIGEREELSEAVNRVIEVSKLQHLVTQHDKSRLSKLIRSFFSSLQRRPANSISYEPMKLSQVVILQSNKQNLPLLSPSPYDNPSRSLKKERKHHQQRKNKSLHTNVVKLPAISIKNYSYQDTEDLSSFARQNLPLFIDEASASLYEQSFSPAHEREYSKPTPSQLQEIEKIFSELQVLKRRNGVAYANFCMFLRYPHTALRERSVTVSQAGSVSFAAFCNYFLKVLWIHRSCAPGSLPFCSHLSQFRSSLHSLLEGRQGRIKRGQ